MIYRVISRLWLCGLLLGLGSPALAQPETARAAKPVSGPMVAGVQPSAACVWLHLPAGQQAWVQAQDTVGGALIVGLATTHPEPSDSIVVFRLESLQPHTYYRYQVGWRGSATAVATGHFRTPPPPGTPADFTFALGSCAFIAQPYPPTGYPIFGHIHAQKPDLMLWLGDNTYLWGGEWADTSAAFRRYTYNRAIPDVQPLLADAAHYAIWDDHDFGPNDADSTLPTRAAMRRLFQRFWPPAPSDAPPGGTTGYFRWGDTEFFLLDDRYWRTPKRRVPRRQRTQLGAAQRAWLLAGLQRSTASFKFVAIGGQFLTTNGRGETFANGFRAERRALLRALDSAQIRNVVFLTGDRHFAELTARRPHHAPVQYELTASPLTAGVARARRNRYRVAGTVTRENNFATISVSGPASARQLTLTSFSATGDKRWQRVVPAH